MKTSRGAAKVKCSISPKNAQVNLWLKSKKCSSEPVAEVQEMRKWSGWILFQSTQPQHSLSFSFSNHAIQLSWCKFDGVSQSRKTIWTFISDRRHGVKTIWNLNCASRCFRCAFGQNWTISLTSSMSPAWFDQCEQEIAQTQAEKQAQETFPKLNNSAEELLRELTSSL
jgi:hypothetical protein